jgi:hypothetical protein
MHVYEVSGGWQAEDDQFYMACFGATAEQAKESLCRARERADRIAERWASLPTDDEPLTQKDLDDIQAAEAEVARGETVRYTPRPRVRP